MSPDKRHQWNGTEWVPIPKPPKASNADKFYNAFKLACVIGLAFVVLAIVGSLVGG